MVGRTSGVRLQCGRLMSMKPSTLTRTYTLFLWMFVVGFTPKPHTAVALQRQRSPSSFQSKCNSKCNSSTRSSDGGGNIDRRKWLCDTLTGCGSAFVVVVGPPSCAAAGELPAPLRPLTSLFRVVSGNHQSSPSPSSTDTVTVTVTPPPKKPQSPEELAARLTNDLKFGSSGKGSYFLTGDVSYELFRDDCVFVDPTNSVTGVTKYTGALKVLFDPDLSTLEVIEPLTVDASSIDGGDGGTIIRGRIRSRGVLQLPWKPVISSYESSIVYRVDGDGLIYEQSQQWSISAGRALRETFTPNLHPPPVSNLEMVEGEPTEVTRLFQLLNGRRPTSLTINEKIEIDACIGTLATVNAAANRYPWNRKLLPGTWALVYLQPGPQGGGVDRRIPFPELHFNDSYQVFSENPSTITNIGELLGSLLEVRVSGGLTEAQPDSLEVPKRFVAGITGGKLCAGKDSESKCLPLPIKGEGLFDGVYLGERLRIGQNVNGGGARVVQIRIR